MRRTISLIPTGAKSLMNKYSTEIRTIFVKNGNIINRLYIFTNSSIERFKVKKGHLFFVNYNFYLFYILINNYRIEEILSLIGAKFF